jgi:hypothetical protein
VLEGVASEVDGRTPVVLSGSSWEVMGWIELGMVGVSG